MKINKKLILFNIGLALIIASLFFSLSQKGFLNRFEFLTLDSSFRIRGSIPYDKHIIIIEVTDSDIEKVGRWPWPRSWHAAISRALADFGAKVIYFDVIFSEPAEEKDDALFEEAIKTNRNIYLPFAFQTPDKGEINTLDKAFLPLKRFSNHIKGTGVINIYPDMDGILRKIPLVFQEKQGLYPHIALQIAMDYSGLSLKQTTQRHLILEGPAETVKIPLIDKNEMLLNWLGKWKHTFKHYSFLDILAAYQNSLEKKPVNINTLDFKDSICLIAVTAIGLYDIKPTPLEPLYPGIGITATAISNIIDKKFISPIPLWLNILLIYLLALIPAFLIFGEKPLRETLIALAVPAAYLIISILLLKKGILINAATPILASLGSGVGIGIYNFFRVAVERQNFFKMSVTDGLTGLFNIRYFKLLLETEIMMAKSDPTKVFTIIMSDVDHFKKFNDTYGHQVGDLVLKEVANALKNSVRSSDIVARYGGEEMIILLRGTPLKNGLIVAEKVRKNIEDSIVKDRNNTYKVTASLGVATYKPNDNVDLIIKRADDGLYQAKESGRNRVLSVESTG